ncbi:MAG: hypothetical protein HYY78_03565 [Betaproteobacteria bacterium]|nr:hypothetical protein [Betaproteobacteria bacterium]
MAKVSDFFSSQGITLALEQKRQMLALDKEFESLESKVQILSAENLKLRAEVNPLKQEIQRLKDKIEKDESSAHDLDEVATKLLMAIANSDGRMPKGATGRHFGLSQAQTDYYFDLLYERGYIFPTASSTRAQDILYRAEPEGRKYLGARAVEISEAGT